MSSGVYSPAGGIPYYYIRYTKGAIYIQAWASALLVQLDWAMRRPSDVGRVTGTDSHAFFTDKTINQLLAVAGVMQPISRYKNLLRKGSIMNRDERSSVMRIMSDIIKADGIIDSREIDSLSAMCSKYCIKDDDRICATNITLSQAIKTLQNSFPSLGHDILGDVTNLAMSDKYCAREEALFLLGMKYSLATKDIQADIISVVSPEVYFPNNQILYIESEFDAKANAQILQRYKEIVAESRLAGFDFVYIPKIIEHYQFLTDDQLFKMISFLYPQASSDRLDVATKQLKSFTTKDFCQNLLVSKLKLQELNDTPPAVLIKIGQSLCNQKFYTNFLLLELDRDIVDTIMDFLYRFGSLYQTRVLDYLQEKKGRFVYRGFYRQLLELIMLRKGIKSSVLIDSVKGEISFPEADVIVDKLHRREKALYALFLVESPSGGINFTKPSNPKQLERYECRMKALQEKYGLIYEKFGGERANAPRLEVPEIRLPMISLIKRQINKLSSVLYHVDDYIIHRNIYGNYGVGISANNCLCRDFDQPEVMPIEESKSWQRILAL